MPRHENRILKKRWHLSLSCARASGDYPALPLRTSAARSPFQWHGRAATGSGALGTSDEKRKNVAAYPPENETIRG